MITVCVVLSTHTVSNHELSPIGPNVTTRRKRATAQILLLRRAALLVWLAAVSDWAQLRVERPGHADGHDQEPDDPVDVVATDPVRVLAGASVVDAAAIMLNGQIRHLVIDGWEGGTAVVSLRAVMAVLLQAVKPELSRG